MKSQVDQQYGLTHGAEAPCEARTRTRTRTRLMRLCMAWALVVACLGVPRWAHAAEGIQAFSFAKKPRIDGQLSGWPKLVKLGQVLRGKPQAGDPAAEGMIGYDARYLYVGLVVTDRHLVRTGSLGTSEDFASLLLAFPNSKRGHRTYEVQLYPGVTGKSAAAVKLQGSKVDGAEIVEAPTRDGFSLEAAIPWDAFSEAARTRVGLRAALQYADADKPGRISSVIATSRRVSGAQMPALALQSEAAVLEALVFPKNLRERPDRELVGDLVGDAMVEKVSLYGRYLTIVGPGYKQGSEFYYQDLAVERASAVLRLELAELTGDRRSEIVLRKRLGDGPRYREVLEVWGFEGASEEPQMLFQHEVAIVTPEVQIANEVKLGRHENKPALSIGQAKAKVDPEAYDEPTTSGMHPALMPWEGTQQRTFQFVAGKFEVVDERSREPKLRRGGRASKVRAERAGDPLGAEPAKAPPPRTRPPTAEEKLDKVYGLYRQDRGQKPSKPRFDFVTDVAGDERSERVLVHDRDIVAFGAGFLQGSSYVYTALGFEDPADILDVSARDMTGDGKAEILVRGVIKAKASQRLGGDVIRRHALFIYKISPSGVKRIFAAETGRSLENKSILGKLRFLPHAGGVSIELGPGRAVGWSEQDYPFPPDRSPYAGLEPLLLPWTDLASRSYVFDGSQYRQR